MQMSSLLAEAIEAHGDLTRWDESGFALPGRDYYIRTDEESSKIRAAYTTYIERMLTLTGHAEALSRAAAVVKFETRLARAGNESDKRDADKTYNLQSLSVLGFEAPGVDWRAYLEALGLGRMAIYRRWPNKAAIVMSACVARVDPTTLFD